MVSRNKKAHVAEMFCEFDIDLDSDFENGI